MKLLELYNDNAIHYDPVNKNYRNKEFKQQKENSTASVLHTCRQKIGLHLLKKWTVS